jgi:hypothetical protein
MGKKARVENQSVEHRIEAERVNCSFSLFLLVGLNFGERLVAIYHYT